MKVQISLFLIAIFLGGYLNAQISGGKPKPPSKQAEKKQKEFYKCMKLCGSNSFHCRAKCGFPSKTKPSASKITPAL